MMLDRERLNFWVRFVAIGLAAVFLLSFVLMGLGSTVPINLFELIGSGSQQQQQGGPTVTVEDQIQQVRQDIEQNPRDADNYKTLASLYYNNGQTDEAIEALQEGREVAPKDEEIAILLAQLYAQQAQATGKQKLYAKAGDAYAAAAELEPDQAENYYMAGQAYEQAGRPDQAIKYWNEYLEREPKGERADEVKQKISDLMQGGSTTGQ